MTRILIIKSDYYKSITDMLVEGCEATLRQSGAVIETMTVPGVLEIPAALAMVVHAGKENGKAYDGYVLLGCVIRGETSHYDIVANESARAIIEFGVQERLAIGNGILTVENDEQARTRADKSEKNKGADAANAALALINLRRELQQ